MATSFGPASLAAQTNLLQSSQDRVLSNLKAAHGSDTDAKIEKGAKEFESMLLASWMQQAEQSMASVPGGGDDEDAAGREQMMGLGVQSVATALASTGGIGLGRMIAGAMHRLAEKQSAETTQNEQDTKSANQKLIVPERLESQKPGADSNAGLNKESR